MIRFIGIFMVCLLIVSILSGVSRKVGEHLGCEDIHNSAELANSFLVGGLIAFLYRTGPSRKKEK